MPPAYSQILESIPTHLKRYVVDQNYERYTPVDQAAWRYSLRQLRSFLSKNAHNVYLDGLEKTGISIDSIPKISEMSEKLSDFGWVAVPVSGFIPPAAFMEMQSLGILPIASDMRSVDHILYTPAPDIVHEAAGHAPILVDPKFASYLKKYAAVAKMAIVGKKDLEQYEAIRVLSDIKEDPDSTDAQIKEAEDNLKRINGEIEYISEAALLGRMNWWTAEYGLIGELQSPRIFGAGLLSSIGESRDCLKEHVKKVPLTVDCVDYTYDITEPQPQLFVTETFEQLHTVLDELADRMSFKKGGVHGLEQALEAETVNTVVLDTGIQISGCLFDVLRSGDDIQFIKFNGPSQICKNDLQLKDQGTDRHPHGFSTPLGPITKFSKCLSELNSEELKELNIEKGSKTKIEFTSGITVEGGVKHLLFDDSQRLIMITWDGVTALKDDAVLFDPSWGEFDMVIGSQIVSVFGGPADRESYGETDAFAKKVIPLKEYSDSEKLLHSVYQDLRDMRDNKASENNAQSTFRSIQSAFPNEWLLFIELLEMCHHFNYSADLKSEIEEHIESIKSDSNKRLIDLGLALTKEPLS